MLPWESRRNRRNGRGGAGRLPFRTDLERLEGRELLAYTPLGFSLPDLTVSGYTSNVASWGGPLTTTVDVQNLGASTLIEPLMLLPGAVSHADAIPPPTVAVFLSPGPHSRNRVQVATIAFPSNVTSLKQNSLVQLTGTFTLPAQPPGFPGNGGKVFVTFRVSPITETDVTNNTAKGHPIQIRSQSPDLIATALDVPPVIQPGDTIQPNIQITNFGPADTAAQGLVEVRLVASVTRRFTSGSSTVATYLIPNIPGISRISSGSTSLTAENLQPQGRATNIAITDGTMPAGTATVQGNTVTIAGLAKTLPVSPKSYFIGVVVDPNRSLRQIRVIGRVGPTNALGLPQQVGPATSGLPPAGVLFAGSGANSLPFPFPPNISSFTPATVPQTGIKTN